MARGEGGNGPERTCIATRQVRRPDELIRFVAAPDGTVVPDLRHELPGRGVWVTARRDLVDEAVRRKAFARGLKAQVAAPADLGGQVERLLADAARQALSLANKAGLAVSGFAKVEAAVGRGGIAGLLHASDAAPDGVRKLRQALRRRFGDGAASIPVVAALSSTEMDLALGRSHVIHAALLEGPAARACLARCRALEQYRVRPAQEGSALSDAIDGDDDPEPAGTRAE